MIKALTPIEEFDEHFATAFTSDEYDTIGGFIVRDIRTGGGGSPRAPLLPRRRPPRRRRAPARRYPRARRASLPGTHVSELLGTRLGLLASICQSTARNQVMTRL